jgi:hypothetical protein
MTGQVVHGQADLAIGDFFQMYELNLGAGYALYGRGCTVIAVPNPERFPVWMGVLTIFTPATWLILLAVSFVPFAVKWMSNCCSTKQHL